MLVLSRKENASVIITVPPTAQPVKIMVMVAEIRGDKVRLGLSAPKHVTINRDEIQAIIDGKEMELRQ